MSCEKRILIQGWKYVGIVDHLSEFPLHMTHYKWVDFLYTCKSMLDSGVFLAFCLNSNHFIYFSKFTFCYEKE